MANFKEVGEVEKLPYEIKHFEWSIPDFFTIVEERKYVHYDSPTFSIADTLWHLELYPYWDSTLEFTHLVIFNNAFTKREYLVEYNLGLRKCDGSTEQFRSGTLKEFEYRNDEFNFVKKSELLRRKSELVPGNVLIITCTVKLMTEITHSSEQTPLDAARHLMLIKLDKLSANFKDLFGDKETCDTTLKVNDKEYKAHRSVLIARSSIFAATFKHDTLEKQTGIMNISDCDPDSFLEFLKYLYCGKLEGLSLHSALNLYYTSDKYDVEELKTFCLESLMQSLTVENVCEVAAFADGNEEAALFSAVQDFFNKNAGNILVTSEWDDLLVKNRRLANKLLIAMTKVKC